ncbi:MAG: AEC family transporter [Rickettsiaceae bacterium]|nr:AEC family transporter [Rickettsiaceae bacterium]
MSSIFVNILPLFLIALLGNIIKRKWLKSDEFWRGLEKLSFYLLFPMVLFEHTSQIDFISVNFNNLLIALISANLIVAAGLVFYRHKYNFDNVQFTSVFQGATRYNNYMFFAIGSALFGDEGLQIIAAISPYLIIYTHITSILIFCYYLCSQHTSTFSKGLMLITRSILLNPFVLASILGFLFSYFKVSLNLGVFNTIKTLADSSFAIGMLIVGAGIKIKVNPKYLNQVLYTSGVKLVIMPIISWFALWIMSVSGLEKSVGILLSCLPCASSSYILSRQLGGDPESMSSIITLTTIFSVLSLSLMVCILN